MDDQTISDDIMAIAGEALGNDAVDEDQVREAIAAWDQSSLAGLRSYLKEYEQEFAKVNARSVELAESIDELKIMIAIKKADLDEEYKDTCQRQRLETPPAVCPKHANVNGVISGTYSCGCKTEDC